MRDLARVLGLNVATISRALRNEHNVAQGTKERVHGAAREMGYQWDPSASQAYASLRVKRPLKCSPVLGLITAYQGEAEWRANPYFVRFMEHIGSRAAQLGYKVEAFSVKTPGMSSRRLTNILRARGISGLIIAPDLRSGGHLSLDLSHFASAACTNVVWRPKLHRVEPHIFQSTLLALRHLSRLGYRRVGMASFWGHDRECGHQGAAAYRHAEAMGSIAEPLPLHVERGFGGPEFQGWVEKHRPEAIFATHPDAMIKALKALNLRIGLDIGVASMAATPGLGEWAGINPHADKIDAAVVDLVVEQINRNERGTPEHPRIVLVEGSWVSGPTVRDVRDRKVKGEGARPPQRPIKSLGNPG